MLRVKNKRTKTIISSNKTRDGKGKKMKRKKSQADHHVDEVGRQASDMSEGQEHKEALKSLKSIDPELFDFLQENDRKLLEFDEDDEEEEENAQEVDTGDEENEIPMEQNANERSQTKIRSNGTVTIQLLETVQKNLEQDKTNKAISTLVQIFQAALLRVDSSDEQEKCPYEVKDSAVFNAVVKTCVTRLGPALNRYLGIPEENLKQPPHKCKRFVKIKGVLKAYLTNLLRLLTSVSSANIQSVLLKHLHYMTPFLVSYGNVTKSMLKRLIVLWSTAEENVRVLAFLCILRITNNQRTKYLDTVLKSMYMTYVKNSKFVNVSSLACLNFMRRSLVEMYSLDANVSYQHVFLYIRQLAIHLRNAIISKKKENIQIVYNWQFVNSLKLWGNLLSQACSHGNDDDKTRQLLTQLVYPFVQICLGTIRLLPTAQYYPLRFHIIEILIDLSESTGIFVPILPFLTEPLTKYDFNKKNRTDSSKPLTTKYDAKGRNQKGSSKTLKFTCLLRASKSQMGDSVFKDVIVDQVYQQMLQYLTGQSHSISFSDLSFSCVMSLKQFLKECHNVNYTRKFKQLHNKILENKQFIDNEVKKVSLSLTDLKKIRELERQMKDKKTPLAEYHEAWMNIQKINENTQKRKAEDEEDDDDYVEDEEQDLGVEEAKTKKRKLKHT